MAPQPLHLAGRPSQCPIFIYRDFVSRTLGSCKIMGRLEGFSIFFFFCSIFCNRVCCEATARRRKRDTSTACSKTQPLCAVKATSKLPRLPQKGFQQEIVHLCKRKHIIYNIDTMKNNSRGGDVAQWLSAGPACRRPGPHAQHAGWRDNHGNANTQVVEDAKAYRCL